MSEPRVAVVGPFSGPRAAWGRLLCDATGAADTGVTWEFFDDQGDPALADIRAERIVRDGGYTAVLGHFNSRGARAALPRYRDAGLACLLPLATEPCLTSVAPGLVLRWCLTDQAQATSLLRALASLGHREVDVVTDGTAQMRGLTDLLLAHPDPRLTIRPLARDEIPSDPDGAVAVVAAHYRAAQLARHLRSAGFRGQLAFTDDCAVAEFAELAGDAAHGALVTEQPGGAASRVAAAVWALTGVLAAAPSLAGRRLVNAIRDRAPVLFTPLGELASDTWTVRRIP